MNHTHASVTLLSSYSCKTLVFRWTCKLYTLSSFFCHVFLLWNISFLKGLFVVGTSLNLNMIWTLLVLGVNLVAQFQLVIPTKETNITYISYTPPPVHPQQTSHTQDFPHIINTNNQPVPLYLSRMHIQPNLHTNTQWELSSKPSQTNHLKCMFHPIWERNAMVSWKVMGLHIFHLWNPNLKIKPQL